MNAFQKLNRKQKRQFEKLTDQQKEEMIFAELKPKMQQMANKAATEAFVAGFGCACNFLYEKHLKNYASLTEEERKNLLAGIVADIVIGKKNYDEKRKKEKGE